MFAVAPARAEAQGAPDPDAATIAPELAGVRVDGARYRTVFARFSATKAAYETAQRTRAQAEQQLVALAATDAQLTDRIAFATGRKKKSAARLAEIRAAMRDLAVANYVGGHTLDDLTAAVDAARANEIGKQKVMATTVNTFQREDEALTTAKYNDAVHDIALAVDLRDDVRARITDVRAVRDRAANDEATLGATLIAEQQDVDRERALATVVGTDFTLVALDAYFKAAEAMDATEPSCRIQWWGLAGISKVEGRHGTYGGSSLEPDGDTTRPIVGIALDGTNETAVIGDTDGGRYDGDPTVDRAVGPMQFIPSTWVRWARDGNADGTADPNNMYDAALTAARYLCRSGPGLDGDAGLTRAFLSYNHSDAYAANVLGWAHVYSGVRIPPPPA